MIISIFNQPAIDDFWSANVIKDYGRIGAVKHFYHSVSGRFFSNILMSAFNTLPQKSFWIFKVWPIVIILLLVISFWFFYGSIFMNLAIPRDILLGTLVFVVAHIANMRVLFEGLYWMSSTICYQIAICLFVVAIGAIIRSVKAPTKFYKILALISCFLLPGTVESVAPVFLLILFLLLFLLQKRNINIGFIIACITVCFASFLFVAFTKGNFSRIENDALSYNQNFFYALFYSARATGFYSLLWLCMPLNLSCFILILPSLLKWSPKHMLISVLIKNFWFLLPLLFLISIVIYLPLTYFESNVPHPE